jgi:multicomponent Na+:H+ antiporter subunit D
LNAMSNSIVFPFFIPLFTAVLLLFWRTTSWSRRLVAAFSGFGQTVLALFLAWSVYHYGIKVLLLGGWAAPYGIALVLDLLGAVMLCLSSITALITMVFGFFERKVEVEHPLRLPMMQFLVAGINLSFTTGDLFNLFVAFEVMLIASYGAMTMEAQNKGVKFAYSYLSVNLFGSALFLAACALVYSMFGTLNFADIAMISPQYLNDYRLTLIALLMVVVFGIKASLFPLFYWLPFSYPAMPASIVSLYSGMLTKVGIYAFLRIFGTVLPHELVNIHLLIAWLAVPTMIFGVLGAISRNKIREILSFHIISQVGYMMLAVGFFTPLSLAACILYIVHHIIVKASLFLVGGAAMAVNSGTDDLYKMGNLWKIAPWLGVIFLFQALSLAGLPPLSGFWGKYLIILEGVRLVPDLGWQAWTMVAATLVASILTLFSMLKIWLGAFWKKNDSAGKNLENSGFKGMTWSVAAMMIISITIGFGVNFYAGVAKKAADSLLEKREYIEAVRPEARP